jgi:hypothetical protein
MSEPENFLARWSRRKQEAERSADEPGETPREENVSESSAVEASSAGVETARAKTAETAGTKEPEFDLASLPPIESIGAGTDVRAFLQRGVPLELSRAALRRAWTTDPTIRDFIEVAENQWDFATGSDIPGFGPLQPSDDVRRLVAEVFQERTEAAPPQQNSVQEIAEHQNSQPLTQQVALQNPEPQNLSEASPASDEEVVRCEENSATQQDGQQSEDMPTRRAHGGALPQ